MKLERNKITTVKGNISTLTESKLLVSQEMMRPMLWKILEICFKENGIDKRIKILFVNPDIDTYIDTIYDLRASPTLYLLNKDKNVILKDAAIEQIEQYLK